MSAVKPLPKDIHLNAAQPKTKFSFDESKPIKSGFLSKQSNGITKKMKLRFFVLFPNFLVYYEDVEKWRYDLTVGGLQRRAGAVKLTASNITGVTGDMAVSDSKYPFVLLVPDISNKRP